MTFSDRRPARTLDGFDRLLGLLLVGLAWLLAGWGWIQLFGGATDDPPPAATAQPTSAASAESPQLATVESPLQTAPIAGVAATSETSEIRPTSEASPSVAAASAESVSSAPHCAPRQAPEFVLGFAELKRRVGAPMGEPLECEHANPANGDTLQRTSTGLAYYRKSTNTATFTDGWTHWAIVGGELVTWTGESPDPPG